MRKIVIHRERALACFAMPYHCVAGDDPEGYLAHLSRQGEGIHRWLPGMPTLRNGQTVAIEVGEEGVSFFVAACLDGRDITTEVCTLPPGTEDGYYLVRTDFDGNKRLAIHLLEAEK